MNPKPNNFSDAVSSFGVLPAVAYMMAVIGVDFRVTSGPESLNAAVLFRDSEQRLFVVEDHSQPDGLGLRMCPYAEEDLNEVVIAKGLDSMFNMVCDCRQLQEGDLKFTPELMNEKYEEISQIVPQY